MQGPLKALGLQVKMIPYNFIAYWIINLPLGILLAFPLGLGFKGIWIAMMVAQLFVSIGFTRLVNCADWEVAVQECMERNLKETQEEMTAIQKDDV